MSMGLVEYLPPNIILGDCVPRRMRRMCMTSANRPPLRPVLHDVDLMPISDPQPANGAGTASLPSNFMVVVMQAAVEVQAAPGVIRAHPVGSPGCGRAVFWANLTNTGAGAVDSDDAVLGFLVPPGAGVNGVR